MVPEGWKRCGNGSGDSPALILGGGLTGTGVLRSLSREGIATYVVCPPGEAVTRSRFYRPAPRFNGHFPAPVEFPSYLRGLPWEQAVLIPCSDDWTKTIASLPRWLHERFPASVASSHVIETFTDKWRFAELLTELRIPYPRTVRAQSIEHMESLPQSEYRDMFLKPIDSQEFAAHNRVKAFQLKSKEQALQIMRQACRDGNGRFPILLQEYISGPTENYLLLDGFMDRHRQMCALTARRRLRMYPPVFGNSCYSETIPIEEVSRARSTLEHLLHAVDYRGIFDAEFKLDPRDGEFKLIEINPRPWWFVEFITRCGVNLPLMAYRDAQGLAVDPVKAYKVSRRCFYLTADFAAHREKEPGFCGIAQWLRSLASAEEILYCWDDPGPGLASTLRSITGYLREKLFGHRPGHVEPAKQAVGLASVQSQRSRHT